MTQGRTSSIEFALPEPSLTARRFDRAATTFDAASVLQDHAREILFERLPLLKLTPATILDAGCATGRSFAPLRQAFPAASILAVDRSATMLAQAHQRAVAQRIVPLQADMQRLPLYDGSVDLLIANLSVPWCHPDIVFAELARVAAPGAALLLTSLGPQTLEQVRTAWLQTDRDAHVHAFLDAQDTGDRILKAGFTEPVVDVDRITLTYSTAAFLHADLKATGHSNAAGGRRRTLTSKDRWQRYLAALEGCRADGLLQISVELVFAQAFKSASGTDRAELDFQGIPVRVMPPGSASR